MGGSCTLFSIGRFILPSMKPFILVCGGVLVLAGLAIAEDYSDYYDAGEDDAEWEYDEDLDVDMEGRKASAKGKCVTKPKPKPAMFAKYTKNTNCPCWWDLSKNDCACCKEGTDAMQCGWPMHKYCYKKSDKGCPGVCNNAFTLSGKGFPCHNDPNNFDCAWCTKTGFQCFPDKNNGPDSKAGSRCAAQKDQKYCKSVQGDCRHISGACPPERCIKQGKVPGKPYKHLTYYECECADGYTGNGIQCMDANGTWAVSGDAFVELEMTLTSEVETFPFDPSTDLPTGVELQDLIDQMGSVDNSCSSGAGCTSSFNQATINN